MTGIGAKYSGQFPAVTLKLVGFVIMFTGTGTQIEKSQFKITADHFLRGTCHVEDGWF
jgi:hypothetical protein